MFIKIQTILMNTASFRLDGADRSAREQLAQEKASSSFLKKRTKKLLHLKIKVFCFFFSKKKTFLA
jgi:hypothetical protein